MEPFAQHYLEKQLQPNLGPILLCHHPICHKSVGTMAVKVISNTFEYSVCPSRFPHFLQCSWLRSPGQPCPTLLCGQLILSLANSLLSPSCDFAFFRHGCGSGRNHRTPSPEGAPGTDEGAPRGCSDPAVGAWCPWVGDVLTGRDDTIYWGAHGSVVGVP